ncbi:hypothetical protein Nepgr_026718 [Nepenthes gracilis]|uniref:Uncharacterized protein n=1 Tax=Nepenthes gracilis TaxID=150966 RepID=A0AAD3T7E0_NEPGR|nr:hypothetical protein Nepgr_026718 [Nepenthes gracilis]
MTHLRGEPAEEEGVRGRTLRGGSSWLFSWPNWPKDGHLLQIPMVGRHPWSLLLSSPFITEKAMRGCGWRNNRECLVEIWP